MPRYSEETKQQARELYAQGLSQCEVGRRLGVVHKTVGRWVNPEATERHRKCHRRYSKQKSRKGCGARYSEEIKQQARELYAQGVSQGEIGRRLGVTQPTVCFWVNPEVAERDRENSRRRYRENPESYRETSRQWRQKNPERHHENNRRWHQANPEYQRLRYQENPEKRREDCAFRRAAKKQATPPWLTKEQRKQMTALHAKARRLEKRTGVQHHVDHIIPLQAKFDGRGKQIACGLHVPWNLQVLPGPENNSKHCKLPDPEHWTAS